MPTQRPAAAPVLQENVGTEWAVRPKILPICQTWGTTGLNIRWRVHRGGRGDEPYCESANWIIRARMTRWPHAPSSQSRIR